MFLITILASTWTKSTDPGITNNGVLLNGIAMNSGMIHKQRSLATEIQI